MKIFQARPFMAFIYVNVLTLLAMAITALIFAWSSIPGSNVGAAIAILGWMTLFFVTYSRKIDRSNSAARRVVVGAYLATIVTHSILVPISFGVSNAEASLFGSIILGLTATLGFLGPLYIMFSATKLLVYAEERKAEPVNRLIGTFFAFFFLPIGVIFLQKRILELKTG